MLVSDVAVVVGATASMGRPAMAASVGASVRALEQLIPPQAVEHEQHDLAGPVRRLREPVRQAGRAGRAEEGRDEVGEAGSGVVGHEGAGGHGGPVHHLALPVAPAPRTSATGRGAVRWTHAGVDAR